MAQRAFSVIDGQKDLFDGRRINVCSICGKPNERTGWHRLCRMKIPHARKMAEDWAEKAIQREIATNKHQVPPESLRLLCAAAGISIEKIMDERFGRIKRSARA